MTAFVGAWTSFRRNMTNDDHATAQQALAAAWKKRTPTLWPAARVAAPWINQDGKPVGHYAHCLPPEHAIANLLPHSHEAVALFAELGIPWHCGIDDGPGNNLLSSQVQCVNALMPMVHDPARIAHAFGGTVDIAEVLEIEPGRHLTFEYIGPTDYFNEGARKPRVRGTKCTSVDAAFLYRTSGGSTELALVEWKIHGEVHDDPKAQPRVRQDTDQAVRRGLHRSCRAAALRPHRHRVDARRAVLSIDAPATPCMAPREGPCRRRRRRTGAARAPARQLALPGIARPARAPRTP